jgi:Tfp pilus assembly protein PilV
LQIDGSPSGLSLFEVVIALAIFACSMAAIGHLISTGVRGAVRSRLESQAIMRSESKMAEVAAGIIPLQNASGTFPDDAAWNWSMSVSAGQYADLYVVEVTTTHPSTTTVGKMSYSLRRLVRDPQLEMLAYQKLLDNPPVNQSSTATTSSSGSSTGTSP